MPTIVLTSEMDSSITTVPNGFIDVYMPTANGEFVKVYLYLLRSLHSPGQEMSLPLLADRLFCTEKDILRALGYWEKQGLVSLSRDDSGHPAGIVLREISPATYAHRQGDIHETVSRGLSQAENHATPSHGTPAKSAHDTGPSQKETAETPKKENPTLAHNPVSLETPPADEQRMTSTAENTQQQPVTDSAIPSVPRFTRDRLEELKKDEDFSQLLFLTEMYLGKTLNATEINSLCYYYDTLHFPADLVEYLVESCVSKGHKSFHYIEAVAQRWHSAGIRTVKEAKQQANQYTRQYYSVLRAFGITDRSPIEQEIHMIDHWMNDYGFSTELICEACSRTIRTISKASFSYTDSILANWQKQKVSSLKDLETLDARHISTKSPKSAGKTKKTPANNRFNNFNQREYDYRELEQQLLKKQ